MADRFNIGVIGVHGGWSTESLSHQLQSVGAGGAILQTSEIGYDLETGCFHHPSSNLAAFDALIIKKIGRQYSPWLNDELVLLQRLEAMGIRCFSSPSRLRNIVSRLSCTMTLRENNIPMPPTFVTQDVEAAIDWVDQHGPTVLKPLYSTKARGMQLLKNARTAKHVLKAATKRGERLMYLQQLVDVDDRDYGLVFLGDRYIGAYARVGDGSVWHTSTGGGGKYAPCKPTEEQIELAYRAQRPFGLDFTCVDLAVSQESGSVIWEVSAFGGYKGLHQATGTDASALLTEHVIRTLSCGH
ncbi:MAG: GAK system ATP-grasp enzyme [Pseudomonadota bacterium]